MPNGFWRGVWESDLPKEAMRNAIESYHAETIRMIRSLSGKPREHAENAVMVDPGGVASVTLSEQVYNALGKAPDRHFRAKCAGVAAIQSRHCVYNAALEDPKYDDLPDDEVRAFFRKCKRKAEWDLCQEIENATMVAGNPVELGRP